MARKQLKLTGKGLKGALTRQIALDKAKSAMLNRMELQKVQAANKAKSMKAGGSSKAVKKNQKKQLQRQQKKGFVPFQPEETVLLVGEGDFTYALSIVEQGFIEPENLVATSFDSEEEVLEKYETTKDTLSKLRELGVQIFHGVDCRKLALDLKLVNQSKRKVLKSSLFKSKKTLDYIMFNFPHNGKGIKDVERSIREHQKLCLSYFESCKEVFEIVNNQAKNDFGGYSTATDHTAYKGKILMTLFEGEPYISWSIKSLARSIDFRLEKSGSFDWEMFPGYHHRRTDGMGNTTKKAEERAARTYVFEKWQKTDEKKKKEDDSDSE